MNKWTLAPSITGVICLTGYLALAERPLDGKIIAWAVVLTLACSYIPMIVAGWKRLRS